MSEIFADPENHDYDPCDPIFITEEDLCEYCGLLPDECDCYSCCGDLLDEDIRICPTCKEHC